MQLAPLPLLLPFPALASPRPAHASPRPAHASSCLDPTLGAFRPDRCLRSEGMDCASETLSAAIAPFLPPGAASLSMRGLAAFLAADEAGARGTAADVGLESAAGLSVDRPALARVVSGGARQATSFEAASVSPAASQRSASGAGAPPAVAAAPPAAARQRQSRVAGRTAKDDRELEAARAQAERASAALASDEVVARSVGGAMRSARLPVLRRALKQQDVAGSGRLTGLQLHAALMRVAAAMGAEAGPLGRVCLAECEALVRARGDGGAIDAASLSAIIAGQPAAAAARARGPRARLPGASRAKAASRAPAEAAGGPAPGTAGHPEAGWRSPPSASPRLGPQPRQRQRAEQEGHSHGQGAPRSSPVRTPGAAGHVASSPVGGAAVRGLRQAAAAVGSPARGTPPRSSPVLHAPSGGARQPAGGGDPAQAAAGFAPARSGEPGTAAGGTPSRGRAEGPPGDAAAGRKRADDGQWHVALRQLADAVATASRGARHVFAACDRNSAGRVSGADLVARMTRFGCSLDPAAADDLVARFDRSGDGTLSMSEFVSMLATAA